MHLTNMFLMLFAFRICVGSSSFVSYNVSDESGQRCWVGVCLIADLLWQAGRKWVVGQVS